MRPIQRVISIGFATAAIAAASMPALSWTVWPDVDFEWYANVGRTATQPSQRATASDDFSRPMTTSKPEARVVPTLPDVETVSPTLPYSGSNRR